MTTWKKLKDLAKASKSTRIIELFEDPDRADAFSSRFCILLLDFSNTTLQT